MGKLVEVTFEIDSELKRQVEEIFAEYGLTLEEATILFFKETVRLKRLPFELDDDLKNEVSIAATREAIENAEKGIGMSRDFSSARELMEDLNADD